MTNTTGNHWYTRIIYIIPVTLNAGIYLLIAFIYEVLASVARAEIVASSSVAGVFTRIQLIIGVFMLFRLAISVLQGIVDPDKAMDSKTGMGSLIVKIIVCLTMLTLLVPISYPKAYNSMNKFEKQVSTKGILFGVLYDFQDRIINGNVLAKLILNTTNDSNNNATGAELSAVVLKTFLTPNLKEGAATKFELKIGKSGEPEYPKKYWFCDAFETDGIYDKYYKTSDPDTLLAMTFEGCQKKGESDIGDNNYFAFNFNWFISLIVGILFLVVLVLITIEVAKRAIKLAILRLIAPIPILSYMAPKSDFQNGPMGAWIKTLFSTYLDLFIQLSTVYFAIFIIAEIRRQGGLEFDQQVSGIVWLFAHVFVYIGLLLFAKEAPKFLKQALGIKEEGGALGALGGTLAGITGAVGSFNASKKASAASDEVNGKEHNLLNRAKNVGAGLLGGMSGMATGASAGANAKGGNSFKAGMDAVNKRNAEVLARGHQGSTFFGRTGTQAERLFTGEDAYDKDTRQLKADKAKAATGKDLFSYLENKGKTAGGAYKVNAKVGDKKLNTTLDEFHRKKAEAIAARNNGTGDGTFDIDGHKFQVDSGETGKFEDDLTLAAGTAWALDEANAKDGGLVNKLKAYRDNGGEFGEMSSGEIKGMDELKKDFKTAETAAATLENSKSYNKHKADHGATGGN